MEIRRLGLDRYALGIGLAVAMLAGCGGAQTTMNGAVPQGAMTVAQGWAHHASGSGGDLLYVADEGDSTEVSIFTYPQGQFYGSVSGLSSAWGTCSDTSGNVYVDTLSGLIYEFAHGSTTPKRTIQVPSFPTSCSVEATTGNLAVVDNGSIDIWQHAHGKPTIYAAPFSPWTLAYDNRGNLWLDGNDTQETLLLAEMPKGSGQFKTITLDKPTHWAGSVQWDGKYVAVLTNDENNPRGHRQLIYRVKVSGTKGTVVAEIPFREMFPGGFFWVQGTTLIGMARDHGGDIGFWHYPKGGLHYSQLFAPAPWGFAISVPPPPSRIRK